MTKKRFSELMINYIFHFAEQDFMHTRSKDTLESSSVSGNCIHAVLLAALPCLVQNTKWGPILSLWEWCSTGRESPQRSFVLLVLLNRLPYREGIFSISTSWSGGLSRCNWGKNSPSNNLDPQGFPFPTFIIMRTR